MSTDPTGPLTPPAAPLPSATLALLCHAPCGLGVLASLGVLAMARRDRFLRLQALQSLLLHAALLAVVLVVVVATALLGRASPVAGGVSSLLLNVLVLAGWLWATAVCMLKAWAGEEYSVPLIGALARRWAD